MALNLGLAVLFILCMGSVIYWLSSHEIEKRMGRTRMLEELRKEQAEPRDDRSAVGVDVTPLVDDDYFWFLAEDLPRARKTIDILMFEIKMGRSDENAANRLVYKLVEARERGVKVRVRLEQSDRDRALTRGNRQTAEYLKQHGIFTGFDMPDVETHAKAVLIDGRILYVGNHNWSEAALMSNKEVSLRVESPVPLTAMRRYFDRFDGALEKARTGAGT